MKPRTTLIIVGLFALLAGYVLVFEWDKPPALAPKPTPTSIPLYVFQLKASDVKTLQVTDLRAPRAVELTRTETGWQMHQPTEKAADKYAVDSALTTLTNLRASRVLTSVTDLAPFGILTATLEVRLVMNDGTAYALTIGNKTPNGFDYYAIYTGDSSRVFIIDTAPVDTAKGWLDKPPYEPTPTPTATPTPPVTPTLAATPTPAAAATPTPTP